MVHSTPWLVFAAAFAIGVGTAGVSVPTAPRVGLRTGIITALGVGLFYAMLVIQTKAELFGLSLFFTPIYAAVAGVAAVFVAWALTIVLATVARREVEKRLAIVAAAVVTLAIIASAFYFVSESRVTRAEGTHSAAALAQHFRAWRPTDVVLLGAFARNPDTPPEVLGAIAADPRRALRVRPGSFRELLHWDPHPVMWRVAVHPNTPPDALARLSRDSNPTVAAAAAQRGTK